MIRSNPHSFNFPARHSVYSPRPIDPIHPFDPLGALLSPQVRSSDSPEAMLSPICLAAFQDTPDVIRFMRQFYKKDMAKEYDLALFLANRQGHQETASLLLDFHANPGRENAANGLHGAAWRGLNDNIKKYIDDGAEPDVTDGSSATPIIYAMLGVQSEVYAWETIERLMSCGARQETRFGSKELSYREIALMAEKEYLAQKFKELEESPSPTILNSSREPSYTPEDNDQLNNKRPQEGSESAGVNLSRGSSCTVGRYDDIQPSNKRPREDSEANEGVKRAREV